MKSKDFDGMNCSIASVMGALGDRWGMILMRDILLGLKRYDQLKNATDITHATLSDRLKNLEKNGLILRQAYQLRPERYEYVPTAKGQDIGLVLLAMLQVGDKWKSERGEAPPVNFLNQVTGHKIRLQAVDSQSQEKVDYAQIEAVAGDGADESVFWRLEQAKLYQETEVIDDKS